MDRLLGILFVGLIAACAAVVVGTSASLPARVASHFVSGGRANGWQSLDSYRAVTLGIGVALPLAIAGLTALRADPKLGYGLGALVALLVAGVHLEVVDANARTPAQLDESHLFALMVAFAVGLITLIAIYVRSRR